MKENFRYSPFKAIHHPEAIDALRKGELPGPIHAQVYLTNVCNTACHFCFYADNPNQDTFEFRERLSFAVVKGLLDDLQQLGTKALLLSGGGEPTAYPEFDSVLPILRDKGFTVGMNSNGKLLHKIQDYVDIFSYVRVSLNAATPLSFARTQKDDEVSFQRIVKNIRNLAPICDLSIGFVATDRNVDDVVAIAQLAKSLGCRSVRYSLDVNVAYSDDLKAKILRGLREAKSLQDEKFSVFTFDEKFAALQNSKRYQTCFYQYLVANIGADGGIYSCCHLSYNQTYRFGNLNEERFSSIWFGDKRRKLLEHFDVRKCPPCWMDQRNEFLEYLVESNEGGHANHI